MTPPKQRILSSNLTVRSSSGATFHSQGRALHPHWRLRALFWLRRRVKQRLVVARVLNCLGRANSVGFSRMRSSYELRPFAVPWCCFEEGSQLRHLGLGFGRGEGASRCARVGAGLPEVLQNHAERLMARQPRFHEHAETMHICETRGFRISGSSDQTVSARLESSRSVTQLTLLSLTVVHFEFLSF